MESESSRAERLRLDCPEAPDDIEIVEGGGSGSVDSGTGGCSGCDSGGSMLDCGGSGGGGILSPTEIGRLATAPKDCCDGRKACVPLT
jgi:hypothetical protein